MKKIFLLVAVVAFGLLFVGCEDPNNGSSAPAPYTYVTVDYSQVIAGITEEMKDAGATTAEIDAAMDELKNDIEAVGGVWSATGTSFTLTLAGLNKMMGANYPSIEIALLDASLYPEDFIVVGNTITALYY